MAITLWLYLAAAAHGRGDAWVMWLYLVGAGSFSVAQLVGERERRRAASRARAEIR
ncbi:hypothetical protein [Nocardioides sp. ChNu-99]|uniref:hypothetical protein n=1 Tax=Nocardioides sp. ChNu-99 TaxID=2839897 RepID=UPI0024074FFB|nr:hypothetical protein [Nocardioides sp. ChNu-99]MDF9716323.1 hypothetical protein [Nocardioides sp. ChNu-99]